MFSLWNFSLLIYLLSVNSLVSPFHQFKPEFLQSKPEKILVCQEVDLPALPSFRPFRDERLAPIKLIPHSRPVPNVPVCKDPLPDVRILFTIPAINYSTILTLPPRKWTTPIPRPQPESNPDDDDYYEEYDYGSGEYEYGQGDGRHKPRPRPHPGPVSGTITGNVVVSLVNGTQSLNGSNGVSINVISGPRPKPRPHPKPRPLPTAPPEPEELTSDPGGSRENYVRCPKRTSDYKLLSFKPMVLRSPACSHYPAEHGKTLRMFCNEVHRGRWKDFDRKQPFMKMCCKAWLEMLKCPSGFQSVSTKSLNDVTGSTRTPTMPPDMPKRAVCPKPTTDHKLMSFHEMVVVNPKCSHYLSEAGGTVKSFCKTVMDKSGWKRFHHSLPYMKICCETWIFVLGCTRPPHSSTIYSPTPPATTTPPDPHKICPRPTEARDEKAIFVSQSCGFYPYTPNKTWKHYCDSLKPTTPSVSITHPPIGLAPLLQHCCDKWTKVNCPEKYETPSPSESTQSAVHRLDTLTITQPVYTGTTDHDDIPITQLPYSGSTEAADSTTMLLPYTGTTPTDAPLSTTTTTASTTVTTVSSTPAPVNATTSSLEQRAICPQATTDNALLTEAVMAEGNPSCPYYFGELGMSLRGFCDKARRSEERERTAVSDRYLSACCEAWVITLGCPDTPGYVTTVMTVTSTPAPVITTTPSIEQRAVCPQATTDNALLTEAVMVEGDPSCPYYFGELGMSLRGFCDKARRSEERERTAGSDRYLSVCCEAWVITLGCSDTPGYTSTVSTTAATTSTTASLASPNVAVITSPSPATTSPNVVVITSTSPPKPNTDNDGITSTKMPYPSVTPGLDTRAVCPKPTKDKALLSSTAMFEGSPTCSHYDGAPGDSVSGFCARAQTGNWRGFEDPRFRSCCEIWITWLKCNDLPGNTTTISTPPPKTSSTSAPTSTSPRVITTTSNDALASSTTTTISTSPSVSPTLADWQIVRCPMPTVDDNLLTRPGSWGVRSCAWYKQWDGLGLKNYCYTINSNEWLDPAITDPYRYQKDCCELWFGKLKCTDHPERDVTTNPGLLTTTATTAPTSTSPRVITTTSNDALASSTTTTISTSPSVSPTLADWQIVRCPMPTVDDNLLTRPGSWGVRSCAWYKQWDGLGLKNYCYTINSNEWLDPAVTDPYRYHKDCCELWFGKLKCSDHPERDVTTNPGLLTTTATTAPTSTSPRVINTTSNDALASSTTTTISTSPSVSPTLADWQIVRCPMPTVDDNLLTRPGSWGVRSCAWYKQWDGLGLKNYCYTINSNEWLDPAITDPYRYQKDCCELWFGKLKCSDHPERDVTTNPGLLTTTATTAPTSTSPRVITTTSNDALASSTTTTISTSPSVSPTLADWQIVRCPMPTVDDNLLTRPGSWGVRSCAWYKQWDGLGLKNYCYTINSNEWLDPAITDPYRYQKDCCELWFGKLKCSDHPERDVTTNPGLLTTTATTAPTSTSPRVITTTSNDALASSTTTTISTSPSVSPTLADWQIVRCPMPTVDDNLLTRPGSWGVRSCAWYKQWDGLGLKNYCYTINSNEWLDPAITDPYRYQKDCCELWFGKLECSDHPERDVTTNPGLLTTSATTAPTSTSPRVINTTSNDALASSTTTTISTSPSVSPTLADWSIVRCPMPTVDDNLLTRPGSWGVRSCAWYKQWDGLGLKNYCYTINSNEWLDPAITDPYRYQKDCCELWFGKLKCSDHPERDVTTNPGLLTTTATTAPTSTSPRVINTTSNDALASSTTTTISTSPSVSPTLADWQIVRCPMPTVDDNLLTRPGSWGVRSCAWYKQWDGLGLKNYCYTINSNEWLDPAITDPYRYQKDCCELWFGKLKCTDHPERDVTTNPGLLTTTATTAPTSTSPRVINTTSNDALASSTTTTISTSPSVSPTLADWQIVRCPMPTVDDNLLTRPGSWGVRSCAWYKQWDGLGLKNYCYTINSNEWLDPAITDPYRYQKDCCELWFGKLKCSDHPERDVTTNPGLLTTTATTAPTSTSPRVITTTSNDALASSTTTTISTSPSVSPTLADWQIVRCPMPTVDDNLLTRPGSWGVRSCAWYKQWDGLGLKNYCYTINSNEWLDPAITDPYRYQKDCCELWFGKLKCSDHPERDVTTNPGLLTTTATTASATLSTAASPRVVTPTVLEKAECPMPTKEKALLNVLAMTQGSATCSHYDGNSGDSLRGFCTRIQAGGWKEYGDSYMKSCCKAWTTTLNCDDTPGYSSTLSISSSTATPTTSVTSTSTTTMSTTPPTTSPNVVTPNVLQKAVCPVPTKDTALLTKSAMVEASVTCSHYDGNAETTLLDFCTRVKRNEWQEYSGANDQFMKVCCEIWATKLNCSIGPGGLSTTPIPAPDIAGKAVCPLPTRDQTLMSEVAITGGSRTCSHYFADPGDSLRGFCSGVLHGGWKGFGNDGDPFMKTCCEIWTTKLNCDDTPGYSSTTRSSSTTIQTTSTTTPTTLEISSTTAGLDRTSQCPIPSKDRSKLTWYGLTQSPPTCRWFDVVSGDSLYRFCDRMTNKGEWTIYNATDSFMSKCCVVWTQNLNCPDQTTMPPSTTSTTTATTTEISSTTVGLDKTSQCPIPTKDRSKLTWNEMTQSQPTCRWYDVTSSDSLLRFCDRMRIFENWKAYNQTNPFMKSCCVVWTQFLSCPDQTTVQSVQETTTRRIAGVCPEPSTDLAVMKASVATNAVHQCGYYWQTDDHKTLGEFCDWAENQNGWRTFAEKPSMSVCCMAWRIRLKCPGFDDTSLMTTALPLTCPVKTTNPNLLTFSSQMNGNRRCGYYPDSNRNLRQFCEYVTDYNGWKEFDTGNPFMVTCCMDWMDRLHCANGLPSLADTITCPISTTDANKLSIDSMLGGSPRCGYYLQRGGQTLTDFCRSVEDGEWQKFHPRIPFMSTCCMAWIDRLHCK